METFKNALLVATPLTENGWKMLKPQLLGQRKAAEQKEKIRVAQSHVLEANQDKFLLRDREYRAAQEAGVREREYRAAQEARVRERERAQTIRALLDLYSDDFTKQWRRRYKFEYGELRFFAIPQFAALLLIDVRQRFYEHIAAKDAAAKTRWRPAAPFPRKLTLVDMRRVCDAKIKPLLEEKFQKELFLLRWFVGERNGLWKLHFIRIRLQ
ncbi:MAG: hypothetical protein M1826_003584 [Phylliscum demangeonii]|nr:MAG: hypothetical protein M1826_003584 [Phylliscum demangeonii]